MTTYLKEMEPEAIESPAQASPALADRPWVLSAGPELVRALRRVTSRLGAQRPLDDVLSIIVDEAKGMARTDKAVLSLLEESDPTGAETTIVRGNRHEHPEEWWRERIEGIADESMNAGLPSTLALDDAWLVCCPVTSGGRKCGVLAAINGLGNPFTTDQVTVLAMLATMAGLAIENARLAARTRSALLAGERERISREMHDGLAQTLCGAALQLESCKRAAKGDLLERLSRVQQLVRECSVELRHHIYDLRPPGLERLGLAAAVETRLKQMTDDHDLKGRMEVGGSESILPEAASVVLYRIAQECLANVVRHAQARSVAIRLRYLPRWVELEVQDDGVGFDAGRRADGNGLRNIRERAESIGGRLAIRSDRFGTRVRVRVPC